MRKKKNKSILVESREYFPSVMVLLTKEMEVKNGNGGIDLI